MKRVGYAAIIVALGGVLTLSGCASTGFLGFLATKNYVDNRLASVQAETSAKIAENKNDVDRMKSEVATMNRLRSRLESLVTDIETTKKSTEQLKQLGIQLSSKLDQIPKETLRELSQILQNYLAQNDAGQSRNQDQAPQQVGN